MERTNGLWCCPVIPRAVRSLLAEPARSLLTLTSIGAAVTLILLFEGFQSGLDEQLRSIALQLPTPLVVVQSGTKNFVGSHSVLPQTVRAEVEAIAGIATAHPLVSVPVVYKRSRRRTPITVIGYDTAGGPAALAAGRGIRAERELVVDASLAKSYGLGVGDEVRVLGRRWSIAGLSSGTTTMFTPFVFARYDDLIDLYVSGDLEGDFAKDPPLLSFLLVETTPDADLPAVRAALESTIPDIDVLSPAELALNDVALGRRLIGPILRVMVVIAWSVGLLVAGLASYAAVEARLRELSVMKAIGATDGRLVADVATETMITTALAFLFAIGVAEIVATMMVSLAPAYLVLPLVSETIVRAAIATPVIASLGALMPMRMVARIDPAAAFGRSP